MIDHHPKFGSMNEHRRRVHSIYLGGSVVTNPVHFNLDEGWVEHEEQHGGTPVRKTVQSHGNMSVLYLDGTIEGAPIHEGMLPMSLRRARHMQRHAADSK